MSSLRRQCATFRFYGELNDFLPPARRFLPLCHAFELPGSVKDMFESMGVPHPEVDLLLLNGDAVDFSQRVRDGDRVSVYPAFRILDVSALRRLRPPLREFGFVLDVHLGRLAAYLRLLGFDAAYHAESEDNQLARISHEEGRILLTRDCGLLKRSEVVYGYFVRATEARQQAAEVLRRFDLFAAAAPFRRCLRCNALLHAVAKESIVERLALRTRRRYEEFRICPACDRIYWAGSHYEHMSRLVRELLAPQRAS